MRLSVSKQLEIDVKKMVLDGITFQVFIACKRCQDESLKWRTRKYLGGTSNGEQWLVIGLAKGNSVRLYALAYVLNDTFIQGQYRTQKASQVEP